MTEFWYRKKDLRYCQKCHSKVFLAPANPNFDQLIKEHYSPRPVQVFDEKWKMKRWVMECPICELVEQCKQMNPIFKKFKDLNLE